MEGTKSGTKSDDEDRFFDALDELPFDDSVVTTVPDQSGIELSSISQLEPIETNADESLEPTPDISSPTGLRRRRSLSRRIGKDISENDSKSSSINTSEISEVIQVYKTTTGRSMTPKERKYSFSRNLKENESESGNLDTSKVRFSSGRFSEGEKEENSTVTTANNEKVDESVIVDSRPGGIESSSSSSLLFLAGLVIKAICFQLSLLTSFFTFPIWLVYFSCMFVVDPSRSLRRGRGYLMGKLLKSCGVVRKIIKPSMYEWLDYKSIWKLTLQFGWGLLWSIYAGLVLVGLLVSAFLASGFMMRFLVEEPIQMKETLNFDYTQNSPVDFVWIIACPDVSCGVNCREKIVGKLEGARVIPPNHKLQVAISLTLPESDYNRNLGIFQVRVDFLSANGKALAISRRPCMLHFKSQPIRFMLTFLRIAPLLAGYPSESQTLNLMFRGFTEGDIPTACLKVIIEQRAEYRPAGGIPEIYSASLTLESELPLLKRILWYWKKTIFIWISMMIFTMEFLFALLCCKPIIIPRIRLRGGGSASNSAPQSNYPVQV